MIACYARVSTGEQSLERQIQATTEYAQTILGNELNRIQVYRDKSTGTDTSRDGYKRLMSDVQDGGVDAVIVNSVSRISRSIRDLDRTADRLADANTELHILSEGLTIKPDENDPYQTAMFQLLGVFAELEANMIQQRVTDGIAARQSDESYHHGRPPLGFDKEDGHLIENSEYDRITAVLELVEKGELSKRKAARELNTSRSTIGRALERGELYGL